MRRPILASLVLLTACSRPSAASDPAKPSAEVKALTDAILATSNAFDTVRSLTDEAGPRLSGSPGNTVAIASGKRTLEAAGLTRVHTEPVMVPHWERGEERAAVVAPTPQPLAITALGGSVGTPPEGVEAEVVEIGSAADLDAIDPAKVTGKIVFLYSKMERTADASGYGTAVWTRGKGPAGAAKKGAAALLIRSVGTDDHRAPHTGALRYEDGAPRIPAAALANPDADMLHRLLAESKRLRVRLSLGARSLPDVEGANVVGDVEGSAAPQEIVLIGAHLDSWDLGRGALDDGAGCAIVIEAARQIAKLPRRPRRTIRVVLFANEENGLRGARAYAAAHEKELAAHVAAMEADLGDGRVREVRFLGPPAATPLFRSTAAGVEALGAQVLGDDAHGGADLLPLIAAGVPVIELRQDATTYFDFHHTANDTLERVRKSELDQATAAFAAAAFAAADASGDWGRVPVEKRERK
jgi:hypothetical protein